jgi:hypothetical protein
MIERLSSLVFCSVLGTCLFLGPSQSVFAEEYQVIDVTDGGTIKGVAAWKGEIPRIPPITLNTDPDVCGVTAPSPVLQVDPKTKGVRFVLVYLENVGKGKAPAEKYWLHFGKDQRNKVPDTEICQFKEHVLPFVRSQQVALINYDKILHNPHFFDEGHMSVFNIAMPTPNKEIDHTLLRVRGVGLKYQCDVHVSMNGYSAGFDHPYFAVTDAEGNFEITGVPPGTFTLVAWHEGYKVVRMDVSRPLYDRPHVIRKVIEVKPKGTVEERFEFPVREVPMED